MISFTAFLYYFVKFFFWGTKYLIEKALLNGTGTVLFNRQWKTFFFNHCPRIHCSHRRQSWRSRHDLGHPCGQNGQPPCQGDVFLCLANSHLAISQQVDFFPRNQSVIILTVQSSCLCLLRNVDRVAPRWICVLHILFRHLWDLFPIDRPFFWLCRKMLWKSGSLLACRFSKQFPANLSNILKNRKRELSHAFFEKCFLEIP